MYMESIVKSYLKSWVPRFIDDPFSQHSMMHSLKFQWNHNIFHNLFHDILQRWYQIWFLSLQQNFCVYLKSKGAIRGIANYFRLFGLGTFDWRNSKQKFFDFGPSHIPTGEFPNQKCDGYPLRELILAFPLCTISVADWHHRYISAIF